MAHDFLKNLDHKILICDGAVGTLLKDKVRGTSVIVLELLNINHPAMVTQVHIEYIKAGADIITTNTFRANWPRLKRLGLENLFYKINASAAKIAREIAEQSSKKIYVAGSIGPFGESEESEDKYYLKEQIRTLLDNGADLICFETFTNLDDLKSGIESVKISGDIPVICQMRYTAAKRIQGGYGPKNVVKELETAGADVIGANCNIPDEILRIIRDMACITDKRLIAQPNAGYPDVEQGEILYPTGEKDIQHFCSCLNQIVQAGANIVGGCCGTTVEHIKRLHSLFKDSKPFVRKPEKEITKYKIILKKRKIENEISRKIEQREPIIILEFLPPKHISMIDNSIKCIQNLLDIGGFEVLTIPHYPGGNFRIPSYYFSPLVKNRFNIPVIMHYHARHENILSAQLNLILAYENGIDTILAISGDPPTIGDQLDATTVMDLNSLSLIELIAYLNSGLSRTGESIGMNTSYLIGCAFNPNNKEKEIEKLKKKKEKGASFALTQPIFDEETFKFIKYESQKINIPIIPGIMFIDSYERALSLSRGLIPGISIPEKIGLLDRMKKAKNERVEGIEIIKENIQMAMRHDLPGIYLIIHGTYQSKIDAYRELKIKEISFVWNRV